MSADTLQFYPTPKSLAQKAWGLFTNRKITRLLDPSAGRGDLIAYRESNRMDSWGFFGWITQGWDAVEMNADYHANIKEKRGQVIGFDFLEMESAAAYSHIIMNPPFRNGVKHVLHAWHIAFDAEIVAILNAQGVRNPSTREERLLRTLIEQHGSVTYEQGAFEDPDTLRKTSVEVALIHLTKKGGGVENLLDHLKDQLRTKEGEEDKLTHTVKNTVVIPDNYIKNLVQNYKMAKVKLLEATQALFEFETLKSRLGKTLSELQAKQAGSGEGLTNITNKSMHDYRSTYAQEHEKLLDSGWTAVIRSTKVLEALSSKTQSQVEAEFQSLKVMEFSEYNIYAFLEGLFLKGEALRDDMVCDVFDDIVRYYSENTCYYLGWKSNDQHRTIGMSIKSKRFILPYFTASWNGLDWKCQDKLRDLDKVFALLDGKTKPAVGLLDVFTNSETFKQLLGQERISTDYFDVRYYAGRGTIHFFPTRPDIIARLNRWVGKIRAWLPEDMEQGSKDFTKQFDQADTYTNQLAKKNGAKYLDSIHKALNLSTFHANHLREEERNKVAKDMATFYEAIEDTLKTAGLAPFERLEQTEQVEQLLLAC